MPLSNAAEHAQHDLALIAGHAAGDLSDSERSRADVQLRSCTDCADLRRDLVAIASATRSLRMRTVAPRDYRLSAAQAARLRRGGWIKAFLRPFATSRATVRPVAMAFTSLGLAGLLVANILPSLFGSAALAPAGEQGAGAPAPSAAGGTRGIVVPAAGGPAATDSALELRPAGQPTTLDDRNGYTTNVVASEAPKAAANGGEAEASNETLDRLSATFERERALAQTNPFFIGSLALFLIGVGLLGLLFVARRVR